MIVSTTPLRVSLFGGSTDNPAFIKKYGIGSVISFTCNLKTYITINKDILGYNSSDHKYIVNYSQREETDSVDSIKNDVARLVLKHLNVEPVMVSMTSDVFSHGSGLASSSSYIISLIKAVLRFQNKYMTDSEICQLAYQIELIINPHCGLQDPFGCGIDGFKRMNFKRGDRTSIEFLPTEFLSTYDMHLIFTGVTRNSKNVLQDVAKNVDKSLPLLRMVDIAHEAIVEKNYDLVLELLNESWTEKKKTSNLIVGNQSIQALDEKLISDHNILAHKLCGAGNGGFFLTFSKKDSLIGYNNSVKISLFSGRSDADKI